MYMLMITDRRLPNKEVLRKDLTEGVNYRYIIFLIKVNIEFPQSFIGHFFIAVFNQTTLQKNTQYMITNEKYQKYSQ